MTLPDGLPAARDLAGAVGEAAPAELELFAEIFHRSGINLDPDVPTVVFCYPGLGVGELACELSGCTNQLLLLPQDDAARLPHVTLDGQRCLTRRTVVTGGPLRGLVVEPISDSVAHTSAVLDLLTGCSVRGPH